MNINILRYVWLGLQPKGEAGRLHSLILHCVRTGQEWCINIRRILHWLPILWRDRWWDSAFLLQIMETKLRYDAVRYEKKGNHVGSEREAHQMRIVAALCKRLSEQDYTTPWDKEAQESADRLWKYMCSTTEVRNGMLMHTNNGYEANKHLSDCSRWASEREDYMRDQDLDCLCKMLKKHLYRWWD